MSTTDSAKVCRNCLLGLATLALWLMGASTGWAQSNDFGSQSIARPTTSPYLNLFQGSNRAMSLGLNYQRRVRPEQDLRRNAASSNSQMGALQLQLNAVVDEDGNVRVPGTGHQTSFLNTRGYFGGGGSGRGNSLLGSRNPMNRNPLNQAIKQNSVFNTGGGNMGGSMLGRR